MRAYTADQWVLFFFFYCLCGWIWESCYVSIRQHRWVNRGFLHGPLLPIYGSGAILILLFTLPVRNYPALLYLCGAAAATLLEYVTGAAMERLFKVRYWDYSNQRLNMNGYICLSSSVAWGFFSILLVKLIHPPIARLVLSIPAVFTAPLALTLVAVFTVDTVQSVQAALDLRAVLEKLTEENEELRRLARRAEIISAFAEEDLQKFRDRTQVERILLQDRLKAERQKRIENKAERKLQREERLTEALCTLSEAKLSALENVASAMETCRGRLEESGEAFAEKRAELDEAVKKLRERQAVIRARTAKTYRRSLRILRGNPSAIAKQYADAMENLRRLGGMHKD
ncbi:hypothetical protein OBV_00590 [Oscillibacter valericigenes Sjm18-20]|nr:hypothetical protein OBV_00590 [Oscillibacter valericigenes Sjm18-20]